MELALALGPADTDNLVALSQLRVGANRESPLLADHREDRASVWERQRAGQLADRR